MRDIQDKTDGTGDILSAAAFNTNLINELQDFVVSAGFTLDPEAGPDTDTEMFSKSVMINALSSLHFVESGAANAYVLTRSGSLQPMPSYIDGMIVVFNPTNDNTGASTVNVDSLGAKDLVLSDGSSLAGGEVVTDTYVIARYNSSSDDFEIVLSGATGGSSTASQLSLDSTPDTDETANGVKATKTVDTNATGFGALLFLASDGNYDEADATDDTLMPATAMALESGTGSKQILKQGYVRDDSWAWTAGGLIYASTTTGAMTQTAPSATGEIVQIIGIAESATVIYFDPEFTFIEVA